MKILAITNLYPPYVLGGYELLCHKTVSRLRKRGHEVHVVTGRGEQFVDDADVSGVFDLDLDNKEREFLWHQKSISRQAKQYLYWPQVYRLTKKHIKDYQPDVVSVWNLYLLSVAPLIAARDLRIPTVTHLTDTWLLKNIKELSLSGSGAGKKETVRRLLGTFVQPVLYRRVAPDNLIVPSRSLRATYTNAGFPESIFRLVPHGVEVEPFAYHVRETESDIIRLLYVGQLWEGKGIEILLRALGKLRNYTDKNFILDIYGSGTTDYLNHMNRIILEEGLEEVVTLRGTVPYEELPNVYKAHDILVFPSIWNEPFPLVPLEAMLTGLPVVASTAGGTQEAIQDNQTGLVVEKGNAEALAKAIGKLVENPGVRLELGKNAAQRARQEYGIKRMVDQIEVIYEDVIEKSAGM